MIAFGEIDPGMDFGDYTFVLVVPPRFEADVLVGRQPTLQVNTWGRRQGKFMDLLVQPLWASIAVFVATALIIAAAGTRMPQLADRLADRTGFILTVMMMAVLLLGLLRREKHAFANIGFGSPLILLI